MWRRNAGWPRGWQFDRGTRPPPGGCHHSICVLNLSHPLRSHDVCRGQWLGGATSCGCPSAFPFPASRPSRAIPCVELQAADDLKWQASNILGFCTGLVMTPPRVSQGSAVYLGGLFYAVWISTGKAKTAKYSGLSLSSERTLDTGVTGCLALFRHTR